MQSRPSIQQPLNRGNQLEVLDMDCPPIVQGLSDDQLLTTVLMDTNRSAEQSQSLANMQHSLTVGDQRTAGGVTYVMKSSPDNMATGLGPFQQEVVVVGQDGLGSSLPLDQSVELVPIQVAGSQQFANVGHGGMMLEPLQPGFQPYRMDPKSMSSPIPVVSPALQQHGYQPGTLTVSKTGSENCLQNMRATPVGRSLSAMNRHAKVVVQGHVNPQGVQGLGGAGQYVGIPGMRAGGHQVDAAGAMDRAEPRDRQPIKGEGSKTRWKPNPVQLCLLEQHFNSGYTKATPELHAAVQGAGHATENQVTVWLKNRLSRCKRPPPKKKEDDKDEEELSDNEVPWEDFKTVSNSVLGELSSIVSTVEKDDVLLLAKAIRKAQKICCYGVAREGLVMKALSSSLHHLGLECYCVGDTNLPQFGTHDLVLVSAGPSYYSLVNALALEAMRSGANVIAFTAHKTAELPFAEDVIRIPSQTLPPCMTMFNQNSGNRGADVVSFLPEGKWSILQMGSSYEMSLLLLFECVSVMLRKVCATSPAEMRARHTNLE